MKHRNETLSHGLDNSHVSPSPLYALRNLSHNQRSTTSLPRTFPRKAHPSMANVYLLAWPRTPYQQKPARRIWSRRSTGTQHDQSKRRGAHNDSLRQRRAVQKGQFKHPFQELRGRKSMMKMKGQMLRKTCAQPTMIVSYRAISTRRTMSRPSRGRSRRSSVQGTLHIIRSSFGPSRSYTRSIRSTGSSLR